VYGKSKISLSDGSDVSIGEYDIDCDAATLKTSIERKPAKIGDSDDVKVGDKVIIIASPQGRNNIIAYATVSNPEPRGMVVLTDGLSGTTVGASGGAVFDIEGCLIGILVAEDEDNPGRFLIIPINNIRKAL
jgi:S1-C subfamily serine protease